MSRLQHGRNGRSLPGIEWIALAVLAVAFVLVAVALARQAGVEKRRLAGRAWLNPGRTAGEPMADIAGIAAAAQRLKTTAASVLPRKDLLDSELRVAAIGSAYPIPYSAEACPFTGIPQPTLNQLDRDGDGMADDWEIEHGLDRYDPRDAGADPDGDGFANLEEFRGHTDPHDPGSHPPYATKLRLVAVKEHDFPLVFQGVSELPDGRKVFQLNSLQSGKSYFKELGEAVEGTVVERFVSQGDGQEGQLALRNGSDEILLPKGEKIADPKKQAELINLLDRSSIIATMGAFLSLRNERYLVLDVAPDAVKVRSLETGREFVVPRVSGGE